MAKKTLWLRKFSTLYPSTIVLLYREQLCQVKDEMTTDTLDCVCVAYFSFGNDRNGEVCPYGFNSHD